MEALECRCSQGLHCELHQLTPVKYNVMEDVVDKITWIMLNEIKLSFTFKPYDGYMAYACSPVLGDMYRKVAIQLYTEFVSSLEENMVMVLPFLEDKGLEDILPILLEMWNKYKQMSQWLVKFFGELRAQGYCTSVNRFENGPLYMFCNLVIDALWNKVKERISLMIKQEREGQLIDKDLLKRTLNFSMDVQTIAKRPYYDNLEQVILVDTTQYYSNLASEWLQCCTFGGYIRNVGIWYEREKIQNEDYLNESLKEEILEVARSELLEKVAREVANLIPSMRLGLVKLEDLVQPKII